MSLEPKLVNETKLSELRAKRSLAEIGTALELLSEALIQGPRPDNQHKFGSAAAYLEKACELITGRPNEAVALREEVKRLETQLEKAQGKLT